ncbi:adenosylcobalamin-dependent ribonucleoside-diphosphate reductase [Methanofollis aquaemaris]|uniref:Vitamin B12-dependent ribonucleotide reductase n=1 Tax=Methanofollis aquaemaris TaxID=126734 RepID=A0A8A3S4F5_9EURY|nr:adenosylcobalamin-dependent ribonucleoside-diphosphate reductase [Methanofollis aquaemaris]QSZ67028.1 adenosylcobalamin-dependent ribonucleoside-diphosphate reductase [Methanofollis aquaemaris]
MTDSVVDSILAARYLRKGEKTFEDICRRVSSALGKDDAEREEFFEAMRSLSFLPNSPTLMNAGTEIGQLSACFTLPVGDSIPEIFHALEWGALIHKSGGGTGYNFSRLRPDGAPVQSTDGVASGPISFMKVFNAATDVIKQGGRRRGANMGILNVWHPDILRFIHAKGVEGELSNFNISVMVNDRFMEFVESGQLNKVWITHPYTDEEITVGAIWNGIIDGIWKNGEPGVLFYDEINRTNPAPHLGPIETTNPCGEQPLLPFESCVLGSINLAKFVKDGAVDEAGLKKITRMAVRFLDAVIDENVFPIPQIGEATRKTRKIGLGLMGVHDALLMLGIPYDSDEGRAVCEEVMALVNETAIEESHALAGEKGTFPAFEGSVWGDSEMRNAALTTIAPTGTISLLAGCSSGIEPVFSYAYTRKNTVGKTFMILHPLFEAELRRVVGGMGFSAEEEEARVQEAIEHVHETGTIRDVAWLPASFRHLFRTALDIDWRDHVRMQAVFQKHVHASISKTINMPNAATREEIAEAVLMAWKSGIKGMTIYRTGSREDVVLALKETKPVEGEVKPVTPRPKELSGKTYLGQSGCCRLYITVNLLDGKPWEVFIRTVGSGGCEANSNALGRSISTGLQNGVPYQKFVRQFAKVNCIAALKNPEAEGLSCADVVGKCIDLAASRQTIATLDNWTITEVAGAGKKKKKNLCPECGAELDFGEGCNQGICKHCGWSGCS